MIAARERVTHEPLYTRRLLLMLPHSSIPDRFWTHVKFEDLCWLWTGCTTSRGYGTFTNGGKTTRVHRYAYEFCVGPIPDGQQIDHLCRVKHCVNPDHLEAVTDRVNTRRGLRSFKVPRTHRPAGHEMSGDNVYIEMRPIPHCRACRNVQLRAAAL